VARVIAQHATEEADVFRPSIAELREALATDPKQFPKKRGALSRFRAAPVSYADGITWRAVFVIQEKLRRVRWLSLGPHDEAYRDAERRT
jgi:hypothetical protein